MEVDQSSFDDESLWGGDTRSDVYRQVWASPIPHPLPVARVERLGPHAAAVTFEVAAAVRGRFAFRPGRWVAVRARIRLVQVDRTPSTRVFGAEVDRLAEEHAGRLSVTRVCTRTPGATRPTADDWRRLIAADGPLPRMAGVWLCRPAGLVGGLRPVLASPGVPHRRVHTEFFAVAPTAAAPVGGLSTVRVRAGGAATVTTVPRSTWLLDAARDAGADVPFSCRSGTCGICRTRVVDCEVELVTNHQLSAAEVAAGYVLTCRTRPVRRATHRRAAGRHLPPAAGGEDAGAEGQRGRQHHAGRHRERHRPVRVRCREQEHRVPGEHPRGPRRDPAPDPWSGHQDQVHQAGHAQRRHAEHGERVAGRVGGHARRSHQVDGHRRGHREGGRQRQPPGAARPPGRGGGGGTTFPRRCAGCNLTHAFFLHA
ncbi:2Fe-2S iron-sulfur cluster-binding protein [Modestobacter roseus]|uniref:2Fe-2S iron-sulfur cluster-binding protein n=1 Tax=Modestobacter roseus TaxID=1181884 RepID=UPI0034DE9B3E